MGSGLEFNGNLIQISSSDGIFGVSTITNQNGGLTLDPANGTSGTVDIGLSLGSGLSIVNEGLSVQLGSGLEFNGNLIQISSSDGIFGVSTITNQNGGLTLDPANGTSGTVDIGLSLGSGLSIVNEGLSVQLGSGLEFNGNLIQIQDGFNLGVSTITNDNGGLTLDPANGTSGTVDIGLSLGAGLSIVNEGLSVQLGSGLEFDGIAIKIIDEHNIGISTITNSTGGLTLDPTNGTSGTVDIGLSLGAGLSIVNEGLSVQLGSGLEFDGTLIQIQDGFNLGVSTVTSNDNTIVISPDDGTSSTINIGVSNIINVTGINTNNGNRSILLGGTDHIVSGNQSVIAGGNTNTVSGNNSGIFCGQTNTVSGNNSGTIGGTENNISVVDSVAIGGIGLSTFTGTSYTGCLALVGKYNSNGTSEFNSSTNGTCFRFIVGGGNSHNDRKNAFTVDNLGNLYFGTEAGVSIFKRQGDDSFSAINTDANVNSVSSSDSSIIIGSSTGAVTFGVSVNTLAGLSITSDGVSIVLGSGLDFDSSGGISVQLSTGLDFDNGLIFNPPHSRMFYSTDGPSQLVTFNSGETIWFSGASPSANNYLGGTSSFLPPVNGYYNSAVHLFNGSSATAGTVIALQENGGNVLQRFRTFGLDDISFSGIHDFASGSSYSLTVENGEAIQLVIGNGYSEWSVNYIAKS